MMRKDSANSGRQRSASPGTPSRKKPHRLNKNQRSVKKGERQVAQIGAAAALLADPKTNPKLKALIRKQLPAKGRAERIARAEKAWEKVMKIASTFKR
ncbi:MAG: hypothetical protein JOZ29_05535, partial [Deltaproteobacteria bacterium]|nr:hypothetical protein [Deltaproteobacteria bacterium]